MKKAQNNGYSEVSRLRGGAAIAAYLAIAVTGIVGATALFGSKTSTEENTADTMQAAVQLNEQTTAVQNRSGHSVDHIDITPDQIFSMSIEELKALSGYEYDIQQRIYNIIMGSIDFFFFSRYNIHDEPKT